MTFQKIILLRLFRIIAIISGLIFMFPLSPALAQIFPVQAYINITPPYSVYLSQYTTPGQEKVMVNILLRDPFIASLDVKFRFTIEGGGIRLTTNPAWNPQPFNLTGGITSILPREIIAEYFEPQNLLVEGVNPQEFFRNGRLPEGFYQFKVEVVEYRRGIPISNIGRTGVWLMLNEPPRIVFPLPGQKVQATNPQMLNFSWIPGGVSSPLSNLNTMYEFTLVELVDKSIDPTVALTTSSEATKFVKVLDQTNLFYGPGEMLLNPGSTYAIRVKAYNTEGYELFKKGGYSEVQTFTFGEACQPPVSFLLQSPRQNGFDINVITDPSNTAWQVHFRESDNSGGEWSELQAEPGTNLKSVKGLKPITAYEVQVKGLCGNIPGVYSQSRTITTAPMADLNRTCSISPVPFLVDNAPPLQLLGKNDIFFAALFPIRVMAVTSQGGGKFSGRGIATLPLFNTGLAVTFDGIGINSMMQLTSGEVMVVRDELNLTLFGESQTTTEAGTVTGAGGNTGGNLDVVTTYPPITSTLAVLPPVYDSVRVVNNTTALIYIPGSTTPVSVDLGGSSCTLLTSADGNPGNDQIVYDGAAHPYRPGQTGITGNDPQNFTGLFARFKTHEGQKYGFDTLNLKYNVLSNYYKQLTIAGKQYYLPWKALKDGIPDPVKLTIKQGTDKMSFTNLKVRQTGVGDLTPSVGTGSKDQTFMLTGSYKGLEESVLAYYNANGKQSYAGGLYVATYGEEKYKLVLIPMPGVEIPELTVGRLTNDLNTIYSQAVVSWNVSQQKGFPGVNLGANGLDWADKEMLSSYNTEMNSVITAFKEWKPDAASDVYYLFVVPKFSEDGLEGFMPRNRCFGFVTAQQLDGRTIAHELGHGVFNLKHTFSDWNITKGETDNLMDYARGTKLWKPQWDYIQNPEATTGLWDGMEEGAIIGSYEFVVQDLKVLSKFADNGLVRVLHCKECENSQKQNNDLNDHSLSSFKFVNTDDRTVVYKDYVFSGAKYSNKQITCVQLFFPEKAILFNPSEYLETGNLDSVKAFPKLPFFKIQLKNKGTNNGSIIDLECTDFAKDISEDPNCFDVIRDNPTELQKYVIKASNAILACTQGKGLGNVLNSTIASSDDIVTRDGISIKFESLISISKTSQLYKDVFDNRAANDNAVCDNVYDWCGVFNGKAHLVNEFGSWLSSVNNTTKFYLTDSYTDESILKRLIEKSEKPSRDESFIWVHFKVDGSVNVFTWYKESYQLHFTEKVWDALRNKLGDETTDFLVQYLEFYNGLYGFLSENIGKLKIDEKYWNPNISGYPANIKGATVYYSLNNANPSQTQFVQFCAVWNFLVETVQSIPELGNLLTGYVTDPYEARALDDALSKINFESIKEELKKSHGFADGQDWDGHRLNYQATQDVLFVASFFIGVGEIKALATTGKLGNLSALTEKVSDLAVRMGTKIQDVSKIRKVFKANPIIGEEALKIADEAERFKFLSNVSKGTEVVEQFYHSARRTAISKFGKEAEDLIYIKFNKDGGATAEIINRFGQDGIDALKKSTNIQDAANEVLKGKIAYRYIDSNSPHVNSLKNTGKIPENPSKTYFSLDKYDSPTEATKKMQLPDNDATWRLEFEAEQVVGKSEFPYAKHQNADYLEPVCRSYPNLPNEGQGVGGATQFLTTGEIKLKRMVNLKTGEVIPF